MRSADHQVDFKTRPTRKCEIFSCNGRRRRANSRMRRIRFPRSQQQTRKADGRCQNNCAEKVSPIKKLMESGTRKLVSSSDPLKFEYIFIVKKNDPPRKPPNLFILGFLHSKISLSTHEQTSRKTGLSEASSSACS